MVCCVCEWNLRFVVLSHIPFKSKMTFFDRLAREYYLQASAIESGDLLFGYASHLT